MSKKQNPSGGDRETCREKENNDNNEEEDHEGDNRSGD